MKGFVAWLVAYHYRMVLLAAAMALLPPLGIVAQGVIVLAVLTKGLKTGVMIATGATALMVLPAVFSGAQVTAIVVLALANWLPALGLAALLEKSRSLSLTTQVATMFSVLATVAFFAFGSPIETWSSILNEYVAALGDRLPALPEQLVPELARIMTGLLAGMTVLSSMLAVFLGRWWQSKLTQQQGAFGAEFRQLRMGVVVGVIAGLIFVAAALTRITLLENLTLVMMSGFMLHGLAVMHVVAAAGIGSFFLAAVYALLIFALPYAVLALAGLGFVDNWFNLRARLARR